MMTIVVEIVFWVCVALIGYAYVLYPIALWGLSHVFGRVPACDWPADADLPPVSVLIAAHNEEKVIADRIANALALDYPPDRLEIVIASDGSSDETSRTVRGVADPRVRLLESPLRRGKASVLNAAFRAVRGEIVLLSDANTFTDVEALRRMVRWFADPRVGVVCGRLVLTDPATGRTWTASTGIRDVSQTLQGRLGALLGANGRSTQSAGRVSPGFAAIRSSTTSSFRSSRACAAAAPSCTTRRPSRTRRPRPISAPNSAAAHASAPEAFRASTPSGGCSVLDTAGSPSRFSRIKSCAGCAHS